MTSFSDATRASHDPHLDLTDVTRDDFRAMLIDYVANPDDAVDAARAYLASIAHSAAAIVTNYLVVHVISDSSSDELDNAMQILIDLAYSHSNIDYVTHDYVVDDIPEPFRVMLTDDDVPHLDVDHALIVRAYIYAFASHTLPHPFPAFAHDFDHLDEPDVYNYDNHLNAI